LTRAWALATSYLLIDARPDTSNGIIESALSPLGDHLWCEVCRGGLKERVEGLIKDWKAVKVSFCFLVFCFVLFFILPCGVGLMFVWEGVFDGSWN
jgi:hypothetical protein